jgi:hypothetical protein
MIGTRRHLLFYCFSAIITVALIEALLAMLAWTFPKVNRLLAPPWTTVSDDRLDRRPSPGVPGHDARGWRNPTAYRKADVVALGDSQTYGENVAAAEIWPRRLEAMISHPVYDMAYGGYGPVHSLLLWREATDLEPRVVIEALYSGNDLYDAFNIVYNRGQLPELKSAEARIRKQVEDAEKIEPISQRVDRLFRMGRAAPPASQDDPGASSPPTGLRAFLGAHSRIFGLLRRARFELHTNEVAPALSDMSWDDAKAFALQNPACCEVFTSGEFKTILTADYRLSALNLEDPRIGEGLRLCLESIRRMNELASAKDIKLVVLLIPTKELVFREQWKSPSRNFVLLVENEERMWQIVKEHLGQHRIVYVDALPALREQLGGGRQPYPVTQDGHPNRYGHLAIAQALAPVVQKLTGARQGE